MEVFKHLGTVTWQREMLKMSVSTSASLSQALSTHPGILSRPAAFHGLIFARVLLMSAGLMIRDGWPDGGEGPVLAFVDPSDALNRAKKLSLSGRKPSQFSISILVLYPVSYWIPCHIGLVLPVLQRFSWSFCACFSFAALILLERADLAEQRAALSPPLNVASQAFSSRHTSVVIQFWLLRVMKVLTIVMSSDKNQI